MNLGQIVYSKSGRDAGKIFVVVNIDEENFIYISDGDMRRFEKAKKKKLKHIVETEFVDQSIRDKLLEGNRVSNAELRKAISSYLCENTGG